MVNGVFIFFHRILCDKPKKSRGRNMILVALISKAVNRDFTSLTSTPKCAF